MVDMSHYVAPKSAQLNADDLVGGPRNITVTKVAASGNAEQPVAISYDGDAGRPYLPCKSMRRVMIHVWGKDTVDYVGRSMTLYCDPEVMFGGMKMGGIRISNMSHMDKPTTIALTATKASRKPFTVKPLVVEAPSAAKVPAAASRWATDFTAACADAPTFAAFDTLLLAGNNPASRESARRWPELSGQVEAAIDAAVARLKAAEVDAAEPAGDGLDDVFPGDRQ